MTSEETTMASPEPKESPDTGYTLQMRVRPEYLIEVVRSIVQEQQWKLVSIFYDRSMSEYP